MITSKTTQILATLVAAISFGGAAMIPTAAQALGREDLKGKGYTCEHVSDNFTICTNPDGHEYWCEESTDDCTQMKLQVVTGTKFRYPIIGVAPIQAKPLVASSPASKAKPQVKHVIHHK